MVALATWYSSAVLYFTFSSSLMQPAPASRREVEQEMEVLEIMFEVLEIAEMSHER